MCSLTDADAENGRREVVSTNTAEEEPYKASELTGNKKIFTPLTDPKRDMKELELLAI